MKARVLIVIAVLALLMAGLPVHAKASAALLADDGVTVTVGTDAITISTPNMTVGISKNMPAAYSVQKGHESQPGDGFEISALLGYNATADGELLLDDVPYHAPFNATTWTVVGPFEDTDPQAGHVVTVELKATLSIVKKPNANGSSQPGSGGPGGSETITDWANVTVQFRVCTRSVFYTYPSPSGSPSYPVNGSTEFKFSIDIQLRKAISADSLALDFGLMKMNESSFQPSAAASGYMLRGYQEAGITLSDPSVNETNGTSPILHTFMHRSQFKQMFAFVNDTNVSDGFFAWASQARLSWSGTNDTLEDVSAFYRTDGESLRVYLASPMDVGTQLVSHDPSLGIFYVPSGGEIRYPNNGTMIGTSAFSVVIGVMIGAVVVGGAGAYLVMRGREEDPTDVVSLEKNRYYRGKH